jgi:DNA (cytosine-5)-methyltransferase 1
MEAIDFFCGAGGLTRGLLNVGFSVITGIDIDSGCEASFTENNCSSQFACNDLCDLSHKELVAISGRGTFRDMLFAGCAPCQPFSQQRKPGKRHGDERLLGEFGRIVEQCLPRAVLVENVPGISRVTGFSTYKRFLKLLTGLGYGVAYDVLDAKDFGVPQTRRRLVLIAVRDSVASLPEAICGTGGKKHKTVRDAISHFPRIKHGESHPSVPNHVAASITSINLERLKATPKNGGDRRAWPDSLMLDCHKNGYQGHTDVYGRMHWDLPAPTLTARCTSISNGRYGHPSQNRAISLREAAALQTFPDRYQFFGSNKDIARQIGNAVPVTFAESLGRHILRIA